MNTTIRFGHINDATHFAQIDKSTNVSVLRLAC
jgi:hypothetical protein